MNLRETIVSAEDINYTTVHIEEWDADVRLKSLSASDTEKLERYQEKNKDRPEQDYMGYLATLVIVDEENKRVFDKPGDAKILGSKSVAALSKLLKAASDLNGELAMLGLNEEGAAKN